VEWGWLDHKPAQVKRFKVEAGRITYLTTDQIARLLEVASKDQNGEIYPFIVIGLETSMRKMEILSIELKHIDLARRVVYIPQAKAGGQESSQLHQVLLIFYVVMLIRRNQSKFGCFLPRRLQPGM
jgi:integrase